MAVNQQAIDQIKLDEAFATDTYLPFNECWTVRMDSSLMVIDDDDEKFSRFTDNLGKVNEGKQGNTVIDSY